MQQRFLLQILLLAQRVSGTTMPIIRSSRALYSGCCLWCFVLWFSICWYGVELRVMCPVCRVLQILLLAQHVSGTTMPIIRSSRVLYSGCCLWYFVLWFSICWTGVELRVMCLICRLLLIACSTCFGYHYAHHQELKAIMQWLLPVQFGAVVFKFAGCCSILQTGHITLSSTADQQLENHSTKYHRQQPLYNTLELLMMGIVVSETC